jgi:phosphopentomutase
VPPFVTIVLDGVGIGAQPDSAEYGDEAAATLQHVLVHSSPALPHLQSLGLGNISPLEGVPAVDHPRASFGKMTEMSAGKDSTTGHWELAGLPLEAPFPTYPDGFPPDLLEAFCKAVGVDGVMGNKPASGTEIIAELGFEHQASGLPIVYTSADSVFQVAAHVETIPLDELYRQCTIARESVCVGPHAVGRVIARPFEGEPGAYRRLNHARKDFAFLPTGPVIQQVLRESGIRTISVGKIYDLFGGVGFDEAIKTKSNDEGIEATIEQMIDHHDEDVFIWTNLVDFDQEFGHRNDPAGFGAALEAFDRSLPRILDALGQGGRLLITADHGNDPTTAGTDHTREYVPVLLFGGAVRDLGTRRSFADHAATVADFFGVTFTSGGQSFLA